MKSERQITKQLKSLGINKPHRVVDNFYVVDLENSDEYAKVYSILDAEAVNTEFPAFETNTNKNATKVTNYFEILIDNIIYNVFLIANFKDEKYYLKVKEVI